MVRLRLTEVIFPPAVGTVSGLEGLPRLIRESTFPSRTTPFLIQVISGGGIPVAEQVKVTGSVSFTVYIRPSGGKVIFGTTEDQEEQIIVTYCIYTQHHVFKLVAHHGLSEWLVALHSQVHS